METFSARGVRFLVLGARLRAVEGVDIGELIRRTRAYYGADNIYGTLVQLGNFELFLAKKAVLEDLLPEWRDPAFVRVELLMPDDELVEVTLAAGPKKNAEFLRPEPRITLPSLGGLEFCWGFLDEHRQTAYLRVLRMEKSRETFEKRASYSDVSGQVFSFFHALGDDDGDDSFEQALADLPSLTETYTDMVRQMKVAGSRSLIVDLRTNIGGWSLPAEMLVYFLYGKDALLGRGEARKLLEADLALSPTFFAEYRSGAHAGYYLPENIITVTDSATFSAGFMFAQYLHLLGATIVGNVPSQNVGQMGGC